MAGFIDQKRTYRVVSTEGEGEMARPQKEGMDYFPLDVDIDQDDKVTLIVAKHGISGFGILIRLLMKIYKEGYFYPWTEREQLLFASKINVDINAVNDVINDALKWDFFHKNIFDTYKVITSRGIQKRYLEAAKRRKELTMISEYTLIEPQNYPSLTISLVNVNKNEVNVDTNQVNGNINPQSKVKKSKVKENKVQYGDNVFMTENEHKKLIEQYGEAKTKLMIEELDRYIPQRKKKPYKDHYLAIQAVWILENVEKRIKLNPTLLHQGQAPPKEPEKPKLSPEEERRRKEEKERQIFENQKILGLIPKDAVYKPSTDNVIDISEVFKVDTSRRR